MLKEAWISQYLLIVRDNNETLNLTRWAVRYGNNELEDNTNNHQYYERGITVQIMT